MTDAYTFPGFKPMLAATYDKMMIVKQLASTYMYVQPKFDGIRATLTNFGPRTRSLKGVPNVHIHNTLLNSHLPWLDGEIMTYDDFERVQDYNAIQSQVMSRDGTPNFKFHVFDIVIPGRDFHTRLEVARKWVADFQDEFPWLEIAPTFAVTNFDEFEAAEERFLENGYEGMIVRKPDALYKFNRATNLQGQLIKVKRFEDAEGFVMGFEELMRNTNVAFTNELGYTDHTSHKSGLVPGGMLGKLVVKATIDGVVVEARVGSGFTEQERIDIWNNQNDYMGKRVKFKHFPFGAKDKPRHAIFLGWRSDFDMD